jgi:4-amino-4-deoxy-L-arabinose transferase-like glycosyltransferase
MRAGDLAWLVVLTVAGAVLRLRGFQDLGLSHYDEGGYAMGAAAIRSGTAPADFYPLQHFLSPPLHFVLGGLIARFCGASVEAALLAISTGAGIAAIPILFALGRLWFGRAAGLAAAALLACSDFHIAFSRTALTDVLFSTLFLLAVLLSVLAERHRSVPFALLAGLVIGLAWNTKYHGWFAGLVAATALLPHLAARDWQRLRGTAGRLALMAALAMLLYLPWYLHVQAQDGGYARLAAEHARFLRHWRDALHHARVQIDGQLLFASITTVAGVLAALWTLGLPRGRGGGWMLAMLGLGAAAFVCGPVLPLALGLAASLALVRRCPLAAQAFLWLFAATTPLYHPYARLLLPLHLAALLWAGAGLVVLSRNVALDRGRAPLAFAAIVVLLAAGVSVLAARPHPPWTRATLRDPVPGSLRAMAQAIADQDPEHLPVVVIGEPALVHHLRELEIPSHHVDHPAAAPGYADSRGRYLLVSGIYARRNPEARRHLEEHARELSLLATLRPSPTLIRLLDDFHPRVLRAQARTGNPGPLLQAYDLDVFAAGGGTPAPPAPAPR